MHRAWGSCHPSVPVKVGALPSALVFGRSVHCTVADAVAVLMPVRGAAPAFTMTMSVIFSATPPTPGRTVTWKTHWPGVVEIPVLVLAVMTLTRETPAWPTGTWMFAGAGPP